MPSLTSFARRFSLLTTALALAAGPALAQSEGLERVEVRGHVIEAPARYDVHAACADLDDQLLGALARTGAPEGRYGEVQVRLVLESGRINDVQAQGFSGSVARKVRSATYRLDCKQAQAGVQVYRFVVDFVDPRAPARDTSTAVAGRNGERRLRING